MPKKSKIYGTLTRPAVVRTKPKSGSISSDFRVGNGQSALARTNTDRTLGASTRQGWRLSVTPAERDAHGCRPSLNTAEYCAVSEPMAYVARKTNKRVLDTDRL